MIEQIILGGILVMITTAVHGICTGLTLWALKMMFEDRVGFARHFRQKITLIPLLVFALFIVSLLEAAIWAGVYFSTGAIEEFQTALYFSIVTFTTLGYGDIVMDERWRLLASFEAANGIILFGWTTALVFAVVHRVATHHTDSGNH